MLSVKEKNRMKRKIYAPAISRAEAVSAFIL
jgi:hypothetical protein